MINHIDYISLRRINKDALHAFSLLSRQAVEFHILLFSCFLLSLFFSVCLHIGVIWIRDSMQTTRHRLAVIRQINIVKKKTFYFTYYFKKISNLILQTLSSVVDSTSHNCDTLLCFGEFIKKDFWKEMYSTFHRNVAKYPFVFNVRVLESGWRIFTNS